MRNELRRLAVNAALGAAMALGIVGMFWLLYTLPFALLVGVPVVLWGWARMNT